MQPIKKHLAFSALVSLLLLTMVMLALSNLMMRSSTVAHAATATAPNLADPVQVTGQIGPVQEDKVGHETFYSWDGTVNVPAGWTVLLARSTDLTKAANDLRLYVDDIMSITTDNGSFTYDSSGGCTSAHKYLNADLADAQQAQVSKLFHAGINHVHVDLKDGCGDGKSPNSKFTTPIWLVPLANCGNGNILTNGDEKRLADDSPDPTYYRYTACDLLNASTTNKDTNSLQANDQTTLLVGTGLPNGCTDVQLSGPGYYVAIGPKGQARGLIAKLSLHVNVCYENGKVKVSAPLGTPLVEKLAWVDPSAQMLGYNWQQIEVTQGCEENCARYRVSLTANLRIDIEGKAGAEAQAGGGKGPKIEGSVTVHQQQWISRITILVSATDGHALCAPLPPEGQGCRG